MEIVQKCVYSIHIHKDYQYSSLPSFFKKMFARVATQDRLTCKTFNVRGYTSVGLSGYTSVHRNIMEPLKTPWNPMELHGISQNLMESHGTSWNPTEPHEISWKVLEHGRIFWLLTNDYK
jgi:hypothetical protein